MKKLITVSLIGSLFLSGCNNDSSVEKNSDNKPQNESTKSSTEKTKSERAREKIKKENSANKKNNKKSKNEVVSEEPTSEIATTEVPQINLSNITNQSDLEAVIYGNYSEEDKSKAYNSAVANNIIPQGTVTEGSAVAAYESSIGLLNGETEKEQMAKRYQSWIEAGLMTPEEMEEELAKFDNN